MFFPLYLTLVVGNYLSKYFCENVLYNIVLLKNRYYLNLKFLKSIAFVWLYDSVIVFCNLPASRTITMLYTHPAFYFPQIIHYLISILSYQGDVEKLMKDKKPTGNYIRPPYITSYTLTLINHNVLLRQWHWGLSMLK